jgi:hypothetical protein
LYKDHDLKGGHIIKLGPGNDDAANAALKAWPGTLYITGLSQYVALMHVYQINYIWGEGSLKRMLYNGFKMAQRR